MSLRFLIPNSLKIYLGRFKEIYKGRRKARLAKKEEVRRKAEQRRREFNKAVGFAREIFDWADAFKASVEGRPIMGLSGLAGNMPKVKFFECFLGFGYDLYLMEDGILWTRSSDSLAKMCWEPDELAGMCSGSLPFCLEDIKSGKFRTYIKEDLEKIKNKY